MHDAQRMGGTAVGAVDSGPLARLLCCTERGFGADRRGNALILLDCEGSTKGSVAVSMMSVAYGRQMPANGRQIDNPEAFQRQIFGMCRSGCA